MLGTTGHASYAATTTAPPGSVSHQATTLATPVAGAPPVSASAQVVVPTSSPHPATPLAAPSVAPPVVISATPPPVLATPVATPDLISPPLSFPGFTPVAASPLPSSTTGHSPASEVLGGGVGVLAALDHDLVGVLVLTLPLVAPPALRHPSPLVDTRRMRAGTDQRSGAPSPAGNGRVGPGPVRTAETPPSWASAPHLRSHSGPGG